jgi:MFS family permease
MTSLTTSPTGAGKCTLTPGRHLGLAAFWFAVNVHWGALLIIVLPNQVRTIVGETSKEAVLGFLIAMGALIALVTPPIAGAFSDRCTSRLGRRRPFVASGVLVNLLGLGLMYAGFHARSLGGLFAGYLFVQLGNNLATAAYTGVIPDCVPHQERGTASGYMAAMTQLGTVAGAYFGGKLMGAGHVGITYGLIALTLALFAGVTIASVRERPIAEAAPLRLRELLRHLWIDPRRYPDFAWVWVTRALVTMGMYTIMPYFQYYLKDVIHVQNAESTAGNLVAAILVGATPMGLLGGWLSDRHGRKGIVFVANLLMGLAAVGFMFGSTLTHVYLIGILFGLGYGAFYSVDWALGTDVLPNPDDAAKDMGIWHISMVLPQAIAPVIAGQLIAHIGNGRAGYTVLMAVATVYLLLGASLIWKVRGVK